MTEFKLKIEPAGVEIPCSAETSLLDAALAAGYFPRHSCRRGQCNACETRVVSGEVSYPNDFTPEGVRDGHILTCRAQPMTDVTIDAPEVLGTPGRRIIQIGARVTGVERVSADVARVVLSVPPTSGFSFEAGQYVEVILRDGSRRSYSMANGPDEEGVVEWHIRAVPGGRFSNFVYNTLKPRDMLRIEGPFGTFSLRDSTAPIIFLSSGTGYAPIAAMLKTHRAAIQRRGAVLYWGGVRLADLYAYDEALGWGQDHDGIRFIPVLSGNEPDWAGRTGFVHEVVAMDFPDLSNHEVYACGNPLMVDAARETFTQHNGLPETRFFSDAFVSHANSRKADAGVSV
ncbi:MULTISPECIES: FAD-binding oxidoreductase [unclassified Burkholderia]|uniref:FAD-binding oxidoreductase n=1 Tax=unclassified Burkholderia TaxID=2613784 RepID=UPI000F593F2F|nr:MULTISPECIES: FAD-binding oxidoreductase [unclassified Burkholderia]RQS24209.1 CDP-6-deoxy-delta-3,4-glucoseen reductase [Burkholderia sp. Bp8995]RQS37933.1 CDP-6-deoxy-delta-3,4-glucoseen reductase [Burkholderia sp. Bp8989]